MKDCPPNPGIDRHQQNEIDAVQDVLDRTRGRRRVERYAGLLPQRPNGLQ